MGLHNPGWTPGLQPFKSKRDFTSWSFISKGEGHWREGLRGVWNWMRKFYLLTSREQ